MASFVLNTACVCETTWPSWLIHKIIFFWNEWAYLGNQIIGQSQIQNVQWILVFMWTTLPALTMLKTYMLHVTKKKKKKDIQAQAIKMAS